MEVQFTPETEKKLNALAIESGRRTDDLIEDAMAGYLDEVAQVRDMLDSRYDELKSGRVKPISGDEVEAYFRQKSAARRSPQQPGS
jgi:predicted DNA-binding protein